MMNATANLCKIYDFGLAIHLRRSIIWLYCTAVLVGPVGTAAHAQQAVPPTAPVSSVVESKPDPETSRLAREKLALEVTKLRLENENSVRNLSTWRGWLNLLYGNVTLITALIAGSWVLYTYLAERRKERLEREEERFENIVKGLGSEHGQEQVSAAVLLPTFLRPGYERFYVQVFNLAAGNLRVRLPSEGGAVRPLSLSQNSGDTRDSLLQRSLRRTLISIFRESFPKAREVVLRQHKAMLKEKDDAALLMRSHLNASSVCLDGAYLDSADFNWAWMREASMQGTSLRGAKLENAVLEASSMVYAELGQADLSNANLKGVDFTGAKLTHADLSEALIDEANFDKAEMPKIKIRNTTAISAQFSNSDLTEAIFENVTFDSARPANPEAARSLKGTTFRSITGLTPGQVALCTEKGAVFEPRSENRQP